MGNSVYGAFDKCGAVYKGTIDKICDCVAGHLLFLSGHSDISSMPSEAIILVTERYDLSDILLSFPNVSNIVAAVVIGSSKKDASALDDERISIPILTLDSLPNVYNGKIAILDPEKAALFVDPDFDTISKYSKSFSSSVRSAPELFVPISYTAFRDTVESGEPVGALHICSAGIYGELRSEDELFDDYRALCENIRPIPLTLLLCPAYPMDDYARERFLSHTKAIFRAAVYGKIRILCGGPCALTVFGAKKCFDAVFEAKELLKDAKYEKNAEIQIGLLISSPLVLFSLDKLPNFDFFCLEIEKLAHSFLGLSERTDISNEAACEFVEFLDKTLTAAKCGRKVTAIILNEEIKKAIPEKTAVFSGIAEFFAKRN